MMTYHLPLGVISLNLMNGILIIVPPQHFLFRSISSYRVSELKHDAFPISSLNKILQNNKSCNKMKKGF